MTKYAGLVGEKCPFEAIVSIANPFDLNVRVLIQNFFLGLQFKIESLEQITVLVSNN